MTAPDPTAATPGADAEPVHPVWGYAFEDSASPQPDDLKQQAIDAAAKALAKGLWFTRDWQCREAARTCVDAAWDRLNWAMDAEVGCGQADVHRLSARVADLEQALAGLLDADSSHVAHDQARRRARQVLGREVDR
jgi:hypothetical protein